VRWIVAASALTAALAVSCDDPEVHILSGQLYEPQHGCLEPSAGVDVVAGSPKGDSCSPECLTLSASETAGDAAAIYVTTTCPPYPEDFTAEAQGAATGDGDPCVGAFAAYDDGGACPADLGDGGASD
jgi:hypothetical protein